jgi:hypothetical protein
MKMFVHTFKRDAKEWYLSLPKGCITSSEEFERIFMEKWGNQGPISQRGHMLKAPSKRFKMSIQKTLG